MVNVASQCLGPAHGLVEEAIDSSEYLFTTIEQICKLTNMKLLDVQYALADMRDLKMVVITKNRVSYTPNMIVAKQTF